MKNQDIKYLKIAQKLAKNLNKAQKELKKLTNTSEKYKANELIWAELKGKWIPCRITYLNPNLNLYKVAIYPNKIEFTTTKIRKWQDMPIKINP